MCPPQLKLEEKIICAEAVKKEPFDGKLDAD
jgi:hypothetical protein